MHKLFTYLCSALLLVTATSCEKKTEKLLLGGSGWNKIVIIDKNTKQVEWEHPLEKGWECNSAVATPDGNILFAYARGAKLIDRNHQEIWNIAAPDTCEMQTARVLPDGNYLLGWVGHPAVIMEVSPKGEILSRTEYETGIETRETVLGYIQRGGSPTPFDRNLSTRMGGHATELIANGQFGRMVSLQGNEISSIPLEEVAGKLKLVTVDHDLVIQGRRMGICFG